MKTAISIPDDVFKRAEKASKHLGISRSEFFTRAVRDYLGAERDASVTASYDEAFGGSDADEFSSFRRVANRKLLGDIEWSDE